MTLVAPVAVVTASSVQLQAMQDVPGATNIKRKLATDDMLGPLRKMRKEEQSTSKRKFFGEEQPGGLVIIRASQQPSSQPSQPSSKPSTSQPKPVSQLSPSKPASKKLRAESFTYDFPIRTSRPDDRVADHIQQMDNEARSLRARRTSTTSQASNPEFEVQTPGRGEGTGSGGKQKGTTSGRGRGTAVESDDTQASGQRGTRRTSLGARGKRVSASYDASGIITHPHPTVPSLAFYKHIDATQPESTRVRQLLIWCLSRTVPSSPTLPPLPPNGVQIMQAVREGLTKALAQGKVDTRAYDGSRSANESVSKGKFNEQNAANQARERSFRAAIERAKTEDDAWVRVGAFYDAHAESVRRALASRLALVRSTDPSRRRRGRLSALHVDDADVSSHFSGAQGVGLARGVLEDAAQLASGDPHKDILDERMRGLAYRVDCLHQRLTSALRGTHDAEEAISARFAALSLASRSSVPPLPEASNSRLGPEQIAEEGTKHGPPARTLLRALAKLDGAASARDPSRASESARAAMRVVRRAAEATSGGGGGLGGRMSTVGAFGVGGMPSTPRRTGVARARTPSRTPGRVR